MHKDNYPLGVFLSQMGGSSWRVARQAGSKIIYSPFQTPAFAVIYSSTKSLAVGHLTPTEQWGFQSSASQLHLVITIINQVPDLATQSQLLTDSCTSSSK